MRLAILGPYPLNSRLTGVNGGVQAVMVNQVRGLSRLDDVDVHIIAADSSITKDATYKVDGINMHAVPVSRRFGNITLYSKARRAFRRKIREVSPDLVHTHMFGACTLAALESGHKKVIVSTHGISNGRCVTSGGAVEKTRCALQEYIYRKCAAMAENIIINNPYAGKSLERFKRKNIYELNNPVSDIFFEKDAGAEEEQRILFAGNICEAKGVAALLQALNILKQDFPEARLMLAGHVVNRGFYTKLSHFIDKNRLSGRVFFLGNLNEDRLAEEYQKASIFALPSHQDVAPLAILQAMAMGKAVVATRVGGIPYIIDGGINGFLIEKDDHKALAEKMALFMRDRALRRQFGANAKKKISGDYNISAVTERLYKIYRGIDG